MSATVHCHPSAGMAKAAAIKSEGAFADAIAKLCDAIMRNIKDAEIGLDPLSHPELLQPATLHMYEALKGHLEDLTELHERVRLTRNMARYRAALARRSVGEFVEI